MKEKELKRLVKKMNQIVGARNAELSKLSDKERWTQALEGVALFLSEYMLRRERHAENIVKGLRRAKARGVKLGGARRKPKVSRKQLLELVRKGWKQKQIANRYGVSQGWISRQLKRRGS
jgi:DNA invertase Pin-like site-specific DNA recombinase